MEPFGLFNFLQSLLPMLNPSAPEQTENRPQTPSTEEPAASKSEPSPTSEPLPQSEPSSAQTAFLHFMQAHDARAKRTRK